MHVSVTQVAEKGWLLLPEYKFSLRTGEWRHESRLTRFPERQWLSNMSFPHTESSEKTVVPRPAHSEGYEATLRQQLLHANALFARTEVWLHACARHGEMCLVWGCLIVI